MYAIAVGKLDEVMPEATRPTNSHGNVGASAALSHGAVEVTSIVRSPVWWSGTPGLPCGLPVGLKCPPALIPSPELQSPFS